MDGLRRFLRLRRLLVIFVVMPVSVGSDSAGPQCGAYDVKRSVLEGEAFYFKAGSSSTEGFTWFKSNSSLETISSDEKERIHFHGPALFFLDLVPQDSGCYIGRQIDSAGTFFYYKLPLEVFSASQRGSPALLYGETEPVGSDKRVECPRPVMSTCGNNAGNFTWYKLVSNNLTLIPGALEKNLWIKHATKHHEGIYTCICTWTHNHRLYKSSGSRKLIFAEQVIPDLQILSPANAVEFVDEGVEIKLNCTAYCGTNAKTNCKSSWRVNDVRIDLLKNQRYKQSINLNVEETSKKTTVTAILTIRNVTAEDFRSNFTCEGGGNYITDNITVLLRLRRRESIIPLVIAAVCVLCFCAFAALLLKCFVIDLALLFRPCIHLCCHNKDSRLYDAYVVYQAHGMDDATEVTLGRFVTQILPSVLEDKCGYRLFIHGRDDLPGQDHLELVENSMKQSRRLIVILNPGVESGGEITNKGPSWVQNQALEGFDWQVGLHHALVHPREMSVIMIQVGDSGPQGYTHLPIGLQHLIRKSAPLRWREDSRDSAVHNSRFWKRVRYLMPAVPSRNRPQAVV